MTCSTSSSRWPSVDARSRALERTDATSPVKAGPSRRAPPCASPGISSAAECAAPSWELRGPSPTSSSAGGSCREPKDGASARTSGRGGSWTPGSGRGGTWTAYASAPAASGGTNACEPLPAEPASAAAPLVAAAPSPDTERPAVTSALNVRLSSNSADPRSGAAGRSSAPSGRRERASSPSITPGSPTRINRNRNVSTVSGC